MSGGLIALFRYFGFCLSFFRSGILIAGCEQWISMIRGIRENPFQLEGEKPIIQSDPIRETPIKMGDSYPSCLEKAVVSYNMFSVMDA